MSEKALIALFIGVGIAAVAWVAFLIWLIIKIMQHIGVMSVLHIGCTERVALRIMSVPYHCQRQLGGFNTR